MELFTKRPKNPEDEFKITITDDFVRVEHPRRKTEEVRWEDINEIRLINTDAGPAPPDVWLALIGTEGGCVLPQGAPGFDAVYDIVSKYEGFNFQNVISSMTTAENAQFVLWEK